MKKLWAFFSTLLFLLNFLRFSSFSFFLRFLLLKNASNFISLQFYLSFNSWTFHIVRYFYTFASNVFFTVLSYEQNLTSQISFFYIYNYNIFMNENWTFLTILHHVWLALKLLSLRCQEMHIHEENTTQKNSKCSLFSFLLDVN